MCPLQVVVLSCSSPYSPVYSESESCSVVSASLQPHGLYSPWNSPGQNTGVSSLSLLQGIFPTQGLNPGLPDCRQILYQLSHKGSPRILEWVAYPNPDSNRDFLHCRQILHQLSYHGSLWRRRILFIELLLSSCVCALSQSVISDSL